MKEGQFLKDAINEMFKISGYNVIFEDILGVDDWYLKYTWSLSLEREFKEWYIKEYKKRKIGFDAEKSFDWFNLAYGLKYDF